MKKTLSLNTVIEQFKNVHGELYDYSNVNYINDKTPVEIKCYEHGSFFQIPNAHKNGQGCPKCRYIKSSKKRLLTKDTVIEQFKNVHGELYDYSNVNYINDKTPVEIKCTICNTVFQQIPNSHKNGHGCLKCQAINGKKTKLERYGNENYNNLEKTIETNIKKYGVEHLSYLGKTCNFKKYDYVLPSGKIIQYQGYEIFLIEELVKLYNEDELIFSWKDMPKFEYINKNGKKCKYFPDVYIKSENKIFEVKSLYTLKSNFENNKLKFKSVIDNGYNFELLIYDKNGNKIDIEGLEL